MKFFSISLLIIMLCQLTIQAAPLPPKAVLFMDRQTIYANATKLKGLADERRKNDEDKTNKMNALNRVVAQDAKTREDNRTKSAQISSAHSTRAEELLTNYNAEAKRVWTVAKDIMNKEDAAGVIDYSGGDQKEVINPKYDITQRIIDELNK